MVYLFMMGLVAIALLRRSIVSLFDIRFRMAWVFLVSLFAQLLLAFLARVGVHIPSYYLGFSFVGIVVGLLFNLHLKGIPIMVVGAFVNLIALVTNGGHMPVSEQALRMAGLSVNKAMFDNNSRHVWMTHLHWWWLGDYIPIPKHVLSPGDVIVAIGMMVFLFTNSKKEHLPRRKQPLSCK